MARLRGASLVLLVAIAVTSSVTTADQITTPPSSCPARAARMGDSALTWVSGPQEDHTALDQWCRGVGPPLFFPHAAAPGTATPPPLEDLVVLTWNVQLAEGELDELVEDLREGKLTDGRPVEHFVLLLQEHYRRGADVPAFGGDVRSAFAILPRDRRAPDVRDQALELGLSMLYVPSMRNGAELLEDRGNAIVSTEPLLALTALELPFERQRRVAVGASIQVVTGAFTSTLHVMDAHLEPLSSPKSLWLFRNPRRRQIVAVLELLSSRQNEQSDWVGTVLGGDFNTIQGGMEEEAYRQARIWGHSVIREDRRTTHRMGRLDYLFVRLAPGWVATSMRLNKKYGSDHYPVMGRFARATAP